MNYCERLAYSTIDYFFYQQVTSARLVRMYRQCRETLNYNHNFVNIFLRRFWKIDFKNNKNWHIKISLRLIYKIIVLLLFFLRKIEII